MKKSSGYLRRLSVSVYLFAFAGFFDRRYIPSEFAVSVGMGFLAAFAVLSAVLFMRESTLENTNKLSKKKRKEYRLKDTIGMLYIFLTPFLAYVAILKVGSLYTYLSAESKLSKYSVSLHLEEKLPGRGGALGFLKCEKYLKAESKHSDVVYAYYCLDQEEDMVWGEEMEVCPYVKKSIFGTWISDWNLDSAKGKHNKAFQSDPQIFSIFLDATLIPKKLKKIECA